MEKRRLRKGHMKRSNQMMRTLLPRAPQPSPHRCWPRQTVQPIQGVNEMTFYSWYNCLWLDLYRNTSFLSCLSNIVHIWHVLTAHLPYLLPLLLSSLCSSHPPPLLIVLSVPQTTELIRALQELENAASGDSVLRQRISSLPAEVQDTSLLHRITGRRQDIYFLVNKVILFMGSILGYWVGKL